MVRRFELGAIDSNEFSRQFVDEWQPRCSAADFIAEFVTWPKGFYPGALDLLATLRKTHRIGCLSNSNTLHWARFDFPGVFDVALSSHLMGAIKPDAACFEQTIAACEVEPDEVLFFDDSLANVEAANTFGIRASHVDGFVPLCTAIAFEGLLA